MAVNVTIAGLEAYLQRVRTRSEQAQEAVSAMTSEVWPLPLRPGTFAAADQFREMSATRSQEYYDRLQRYANALEGLAAGVESIIANWEDTDESLGSHFEDFDAALTEADPTPGYNGEL
ncbi:hypothetical protein GCM10029992_09850 [Glycomyces albus]